MPTTIDLGRFLICPNIQCLRNVYKFKHSIFGEFLRKFVFSFKSRTMNSDNLLVSGTVRFATLLLSIRYESGGVTFSTYNYLL